jgi:hypothetical protein
MTRKRWSLRLSEPVRVSPVSTLVTLKDARAFILSLSDTDQLRPHRQQFAKLPMPDRKKPPAPSVRTPSKAKQRSARRINA